MPMLFGKCIKDLRNISVFKKFVLPALLVILVLFSYSSFSMPKVTYFCHCAKSWSYSKRYIASILTSIYWGILTGIALYMGRSEDLPYILDNHRIKKTISPSMNNPGKLICLAGNKKNYPTRIPRYDDYEITDPEGYKLFNKIMKVYEKYVPRWGTPEKYFKEKLKSFESQLKIHKNDIRYTYVAYIMYFRGGDFYNAVRYWRISYKLWKAKESQPLGRELARERRYMSNDMNVFACGRAFRGDLHGAIFLYKLIIKLYEVKPDPGHGEKKLLKTLKRNIQHLQQFPNGTCVDLRDKEF